MTARAEAVARMFSGGCLCGALRYQAVGTPLYAGLCFCADCRKASGSGCMPFLGMAREAVQFSGATLAYRSKAANGGDAVRNSCPCCGGLVFGGEVGLSESFTIYAGSLDDAAWFVPAVAIFTAGRPDWAVVPAGLAEFPGMPPGA